jgi:hypothetical protein
MTRLPGISNIHPDQVGNLSLDSLAPLGTPHVILRATIICGSGHAFNVLNGMLASVTERPVARSAAASVTELAAGCPSASVMERAAARSAAVSAAPLESTGPAPGP